MQSYPIMIASLTAWLVILTLVFVLLERFFTLRSAPGGRKGVGRDLAYYFLNSLVPTAILGLLGAVLAATVGRLLPQPWHDFVGTWPLWARSLVFFVVGEVGYYWGHRWTHVSPFLWRFHAVHHAAEHVDWLTNTRAHPLDMIFGRLCGLVPAYALGLVAPTTHTQDIVPLLILFVTTAWGFFIHANLRWRYGPLEEVIATPAFHHWHHTNDPDHRDRNFAATLPVLDRIFGTMHLPRRAWPSVYGVDAKIATSLHGQILDPLTPGR